VSILRIYTAVIRLDTPGLLRDDAHEDDALKELSDEVNTVPDWPDGIKLLGGKRLSIAMLPSL
jgi:hypothetical protein